MGSPKILLTGAALAPEDISLFVNDPEAMVQVGESSLAAVQRSHEFLNHALGGAIIYGVNTGFGPMASRIIAQDQLVELQHNLIRSHAVGMGSALPEAYVLAAMMVRLNTLAKGFSGVSPELIDRLQTFINKRVIPVVPEHGAVGASGDLVQLAHIALALMGEGEVCYQGRREPTAAVLDRLQIKAYTLKPKEGLSLINGTSFMTGIAALLAVHARRVLSIAVRNGAFALELVRGYSDSVSKQLHMLRPHPGQLTVARRLRTLLRTSRLIRSRSDSQEMMEFPGEVHRIPETVQEIYSFRCIPQILGPAFDSLQRTWREVKTEMNAVTDNPIVDWEGGLFLHGGNFHGDYIASSVDQLKIPLVKLTLLSERRVNFFLNENVNRVFPPFLNLQQPGLTLALQGLQFVATSTAAQSQTFAFPHSLHSISTNADNQDVVSMGTDAALFAMKIIENAYIVLAIETITLAQAADYLGVAGALSESSRELFGAVRNVFPKIENDRVIMQELARVVDLLKHQKNLDLEWRFDREDPHA